MNTDYQEAKKYNNYCLRMSVWVCLPNEIFVAFILSGWLIRMPPVMHLECDGPVVCPVLFTDLFSQRFFGSDTFGDDIRCSDTF